MQLKIGGKDKDGAVCFKNKLFGGKEPTSLCQCKMKMIGSQGRTRLSRTETSQKGFVQIFLKVKMTEGRDKDLAVCFKKALFLFKILLHASPITSPPDGSCCGDFCDG